MFQVNERKVSALVDIGATHSFVSKGMAKELELKIGINTSKIQVVNAQAK